MDEPNELCSGSGFQVQYIKWSGRLNQITRGGWRINKNPKNELDVIYDKEF